ncbi:MAG: FAD-dependent monooxygenase [Gammaproteobacteria bacterium]|nr:FAD-dependent monooxygenase [Gammaproteobacteria bacterium]
MPRPKIAIIGASIVGMACTTLLHRAGFHVTTFEQRKAGVADDRGVGLAFPCELIDQLKQQDLIDPDFSPLIIEHRELYAYDKEKDQERLLVTQPTHISTMNWGLLYQQLKKHLPSELVNYEYKLMKIERHNTSTHLIFNNGQVLEFDYVIFTDGSQSIGRTFLFPQAQPEFAGYIAWRTAIITDDSDKIQRLLQRQPLYGYSRGIGFSYLIPSKNKNEHTINCLIYDKITDNHPLFNGKMREANKNIPSHLLPESYLEYYRNLVQTEFPPFPRDLFSRNIPFIQTIRDTLIDSYYENKIALIGDASTLLRPVTGSGATKGLQDSLELMKQLRRTGNIDQAFTAWSLTQARAAKHLFELGKSLSDFYVMDTPDWTTVTSTEIQELWNSITKNANWYITKSAKN